MSPSERVTVQTLGVLQQSIKSELWRMRSLAEQQLFLDDLICTPARAGDLVAELMTMAGDDSAPAEQRSLGVTFCAWLVALRRAVRDSAARQARSRQPAALDDLEPTDVRAFA